MGEGTKFAQNKLPPKSPVATIPGNFCHKKQPGLITKSTDQKTIGFL